MKLLFVKLFFSLLIYFSLFTTSFAAEEVYGPVPAESAEHKQEDNSQEKVTETIRRILISEKNPEVYKIEVEKSLVKNAYKKNEYKPIWLDGVNTTTKIETAMQFLSLSEANGLNPDEINTKIFRNKLEKLNSTKAAATDILITYYVAKMIKQIGNGMATPGDAGIDSYNINPHRVKNLSKSILELAETDSVENFIENYSPESENYRTLKIALAKLIAERDSKEVVFPKIQEGPDVLPNGRDYRIELIAKRFGNPRTINQRAKDDKFLYYNELKAEVIKFQKKFGIKPTGIINNKTVQALNIDENDLIRKIAANMDRLRWVPDEVEPKRLELNIASQKLTAYEKGKKIFEQALVIGRSEKKTAVMNTKFQTIVFNPYWHAPRGYTLNFLLPILRENKDYLKTEELKLINFAADGRWQTIDPETVNFKKINEKNLNFIIRQDPGKKNALGPMKFSLANNFDIYMHGTAEPWLFSSDYRAQSSGCIRVEDPLKLALYALEDNTDVPKEKYMSYYDAFNDEKLPKEDLPKQVNVAMKEPIPVYINYQTVSSDDDGNLTFVDDIYGWDKQMNNFYSKASKN